MATKCQYCDMYVDDSFYAIHLRQEHPRIAFKSLDRDVDVDVDVKVTHSSGASSSLLQYRFDLIPEVFNIRLARRFTQGLHKYGMYNYRLGMYDSEYIQERIGHLKAHLSNFINPQDKTVDDDLAAIAWGCAFLMECQADPKAKEALNQALARMNPYGI